MRPATLANSGSSIPPEKPAPELHFGGRRDQGLRSPRLDAPPVDRALHQRRTLADVGERLALHPVDDCLPDREASADVADADRVDPPRVLADAVSRPIDSTQTWIDSRSESTRQTFEADASIHTDREIVNIRHPPGFEKSVRSVPCTRCPRRSSASASALPAPGPATEQGPGARTSNR